MNFETVYIVSLLLVLLAFSLVVYFFATRISIIEKIEARLIDMNSQMTSTMESYNERLYEAEEEIIRLRKETSYCRQIIFEHTISHHIDFDPYHSLKVKYAGLGL